MVLGGELYAFRRLVQVGDTTFYGLGSIDESSQGATRAAMLSLAYLALGATILAFVASFWLARMVSEPVDRLSRSLAAMAAARTIDARLPATGSSRELDALTDTFNALMQSVAEAEAQTQSATPARSARSRPLSTPAIRTRPAIRSGSACCRSPSAGRCLCRRTMSRCCDLERCCTTSAKSACPTMSCGSREH